MTTGVQGELYLLTADRKGQLMPQHSKGERDKVTVRPPKELGVKEIAERAGYSTSQYISDFLAIALGHPELVAGPNTKRGQTSAIPGMPDERELRAIAERMSGQCQPSSSNEREVVASAA